MSTSIPLTAEVLIAILEDATAKLRAFIEPSPKHTPVAGSISARIAVLVGFAKINPTGSPKAGRGVVPEEARQIAARGGYDPQGVAGFYAWNYLGWHSDGGRMITKSGLAWLAEHGVTAESGWKRVLKPAA